MTTGRRAGSIGCGRASGACSRATTGAASARPGSGALPGPIARFLRTSTVTVLERPCEKLWRTWPVSTPLRSSSLPPVRVRSKATPCSIRVAHLPASSPSLWLRHRRGQAVTLARSPPPPESRRPSPHRRSAERQQPRRCVYHMLAAKADPISAAVSTQTSGKSHASARIFRRAPDAPSIAATRLRLPSVLGPHPPPSRSHTDSAGQRGGPA